MEDSRVVTRDQHAKEDASERKEKENVNNIVCFYPEHALRKAISKSTVRTVFALANRKQGQSYMFDPSTTFLYLVLVFTFVFKLFYM